MMLAVAAVAIVLVPVKYVFIDKRPRDVLLAAIGALGGESTVYADGYSESKFRSIRAGMTARQVEEILGPPLLKGQWQVANGSGGPVTPGVGRLDDVWS